MKILIITDAWHPQVNGVVRTLHQTVESLRGAGHIVEVIAPSDGYFTLPLPTYPDIRLAPFAYRGRAYRHGRAAWANGPGSLPQMGDALYD